MVVQQCECTVLRFVKMINFVINIYIYIYVSTILKKLYGKWENSNTKNHIFYDSIYMKCPELVNP